MLPLIPATCPLPAPRRGGGGVGRGFPPHVSFSVKAGLVPISKAVGV